MRRFIFFTAIFFLLVIPFVSADVFPVNASYFNNLTHDSNSMSGILFISQINQTLQNISRSHIDTAPFCIVINGRTNVTILTANWTGNTCIANVDLTEGTLYRIGTYANDSFYRVTYNNSYSSFPGFPVQYPGIGNFTGGCFGATCETYTVGSTIYSITNLTLNTIQEVRSLNVVLNSPNNSQIFNVRSIIFNTTLTALQGTNLTNATLYVWNITQGIFNRTTTTLTGNMSNSTTWNVTGFPLGDFTWNVLGCTDSTTAPCFFAPTNYSFIVGATFSNETYSSTVYETSYQTFSITVDLAESATLSTAFLVYNGTNYSVSNIIRSGSIYTLSRTIDIPVLDTPFANSTKNFYWSFLFSNSQQAQQLTPTRQQNVSFINLQLCNSTYAIEAIHFTMYDEINQTILNATANPTNFLSSWRYWTGSGTAYKNYSFQNISSTLNNYGFCIFPTNSTGGSSINFTIQTNNDIDYSAANFRENQYHLRNATLTNMSSNVTLYLIDDTTAQKFFLTFRQGTSLVTDATITVEKYFTGLGRYITVGILLTDESGESTMWQDIDQRYKYTAVRNGQFLGRVEKESICSVAPCTLTIDFGSNTTNPLTNYYNRYSVGVLSNISYNKNTSIATYDFIDITGLAHYFRFEIHEIKYNQTGRSVCNEISYTPAGSITCNLTGYSGEFVATGYVSRSPELIDQILNILTNRDAIDDLGLVGLFAIMGIIITVVFAAAIITRGSPSGVLWALGAIILLLKLGTLFPFTWTMVIVIEFVILILIWQVKT